MIRRLVAVLIAVATILAVPMLGSSAFASTPPTTAEYGYDAAPTTLESTLGAGLCNADARAPTIRLPLAGLGGVSASPVVFVAAETTTEGADIGATTAHGAERVAGAGATRGGVLTPEQIVQVRGSGQLLTQADGATVRALQNSAGRYDVVVDGERGLITTFNNLSQKSFDRLANNYGWTP